MFLKFKNVFFANKSAVARFGNDIIGKNISLILRDANLLESIDLARAKFLTSLPKSLGINPENQNNKKLYSVIKKIREQFYILFIILVKGLNLDPVPPARIIPFVIMYLSPFFLRIVYS